MKSASSLVAMAAMAQAAHPVRQQIVDEVRAAGASWAAVEPAANKFASMDEDVIRGLMGTIIEPAKNATEREPVPEFTFPVEFDARTEFASCLHPIRDQMKCGSCWAFSVAETWADNACILGVAGATKDTTYSTEQILACATFGSSGCRGGRINYAFDYVASDGLVTEECFPYSSGNGTVEACPAETGANVRTCSVPGEAWKAAMCTGKLNDCFTPDLLKQGIRKLGAVAAGFTVFEDFMSYGAGVYKHVTGKELGGHAIKVVGWGVDNSTGVDDAYWLVANSWGAEWGEEGYFRFSMSDVDCHFGAGGGYNCGAALY